MSSRLLNERRGAIVSIITVVRNAAGPLTKTIESVRSQTYDGIEFVVVDGASTDGTADLVRTMSNMIDTWISEPDRGLYDAMNKGKSLARGDFAIFVNAGDTFVSESAIADIMGYITDRETLYFGKVRLTDCTGTLSWEVPPVSKRTGGPPRKYLPHHQSILYPRRFYSRFDYEPGMGYRADVAFTTRAWTELRHRFTNVLLVDSELGGISSRAIPTLGDLRREVRLETGFARHIAATTGRRAQLLEITAGTVLKYLATKIGGLPLMHRLMYSKHAIRSWVAELRG